MTCVVGLTDGNTIYMGGDSATVSTEYGLALQSSYRKVVRNGDFLIGTAGSARVGQILKNVFEPPPCDGDIHRYMVKDFAKAVHDCIESQDAKEQYKDSEILVGYKGRLFYIGCNYMVSEHVKGYHAIGCAGEVALGVLNVLNRYVYDIDPKKRIEVALEVAQEFNVYVRSPFYIESIDA